MANPLGILKRYILIILEGGKGANIMKNTVAIWAVIAMILKETGIMGIL